MLLETQGPRVTTDTEVFWEGLRDHKLMLQTCSDCSQHRWPPGPMCPFCGSLRFTWGEGPTEGELYSWAIANHPANPSLASQVPYAMVLVQVADNVRLVGNLLGYAGEELRAGERLHMVFETRDDDVVIYNFVRPVQPDADTAKANSRSDGKD